MKKTILFILYLNIAMMVQAQVSKTVSISAGGLSVALTENEKDSVTSLTITGTIDARDFKTMEYNMPELKIIDLSRTTVVAYSGTEGTDVGRDSIDYPANTIPDYAFSRGLTGNTNLISIIFPSMVTSVGYGAFYSCTAVNSITLTSTITHINMVAFGGCTSLDTIDLPSSVQYIGEGAFSGCSSLVSITIPPSVNTIGRIAFSRCSSLISITIPSSVSSIGDNIFSGPINVAEGNPYYSSIDGVLFDKQKTELIHFPVTIAGNYIIPPSVNSIVFNAFNGCARLVSLTIPSSVTSIKNAFYGCSGLTSIYIYCDSPIVLSSSTVFEGIDKTTCKLYVPFESFTLYTSTSQWQDFSTIIEMPEFKLSATTFSFSEFADTATVEIITGQVWTATSDKTWLTVDPDSGIGSQTITLIAEANTIQGAPRGATVTVSVPGIIGQTIVINQKVSYSSVNVIAGELSEAFSPEDLLQIRKLAITGTIDARDFKTMRDSMPLLAELDLSGVTIVAYTGDGGTYPENFSYYADAIPYCAFSYPNSWSGKKSLTSVLLPASVTTIDSHAFKGCEWLTSIKIPASVEEIGHYTFFGCYSLSAINIPESVRFIGDYAFAENNGLFAVDENNQYFSSLDGVLYNKEQSGLIQCPISVEGIDGTFYIPDQVTSIGNGAFFGSGLWRIVLPESNIKSIGDYTFAYCFSLMVMTIPASVDSIGNYAFYECSSLIRFHSKKETPIDLSTSQGVFEGIDKIKCPLQTPFGTSDLYKVANQWKDFADIYEELGMKALTTLLDFSANQDSAMVDIYSNIPANYTWTVNSDKPWLKADLITGSDLNKKLKITADANLFSGTRAATVKVAVGSISTTIIIKQESPVLVETDLIAHYPLSNDANDVTGKNGPMILINTPFQNEGIYCDSALQTCQAHTPMINLNHNSFSLYIDFMVSVKKEQPVLLCEGNIGIFLKADGTIALIYYKDYIRKIIKSNQKYSLNQWHNAQISFDGATIRLFLDSTLACSITVQPDQASGSAANVIKKGDAFEGYLRNLKIYQEVQTPICKTVNATAGNLKNYLSTFELNTTTKLIIAGTIDARDFKTMRDDMPVLAELDLSGATVVSYTGTQGTQGSMSLVYPANNIPQYAFCLPSSSIFKLSLTSAILPNGLTTIGFSSFYCCSGLNTVVITPSVTYIDAYAFSNCTGLAFISIPSSVTTIQPDAFSGCGSFEVNKANPKYASVDGILFNRALTTLCHFPGSTTGNYTIPSFVTSIQSGAFRYCSGLTSIYIPPTITSIGSFAFVDCSNLRSIYADSYSPVDLSSVSLVFSSVDKTGCILYVPQGSRESYTISNQWQDFNNIVEVQKVFISSDHLSFGARANTKKVFVSSDVAWTAISNQDWLTISPDSEIGRDSIAFSVTENSLDSTRTATVTVSVPGFDDKIVNITQGCVKVVTAGGLKEQLGDQISKITSLTLSGTIDARDFKTMRDDMPLLTDIDLSRVTIVAYSGTEGTDGTNSTNYLAYRVPVYSFINSYGEAKTSLTSILLPASVNYIGNYAFKSCTGMTSIYIPSSVIGIGYAAFWYNPCLINVDVGNQAFSSIEGVLFNRAKTSLLQCPVSKTGIYQVPSSVSYIGQYAFLSCNALTSIIIPSSVTVISRFAFSGCSGLTTIYSFSDVPVDLSTSVNVFGSISKTSCILYVPYNSKTLYQAANQWKDFTQIEEMLGFTLSDTTSHLSAFEGSSDSIFINSNTDWSASSDQTWLIVSPTIGTGNDTLVFISETNPTVSIRTAKVTISATGVALQTITVTQAAGTVSTISNEIEIEDSTFTSGITTCFNAYDTITVAGTSAVTFTSGSSVELIAGKSIRLLPGFYSQSGSYMYAHITSDSVFCDGSKGSSIVYLPNEKSSEDETILFDQSILAAEKSMKVYPNPNNGRFIIELQNFDVNSEVCVYNALGKRVYQSAEISNSRCEIALPEITQGIYFVRVINGKDQFTNKIIVK